MIYYLIRVQRYDINNTRKVLKLRKVVLNVLFSNIEKFAKFRYLCSRNFYTMEWLIDWGYLGLFIGSFIAATILPFSSDVMLVALLATGADPIIAIISATAGNWIGGLTSYWVGYLGRWDWMERYLGVKRKNLEAQSLKIKKYGSLLALMTWLPIVGDIMAVALGFYKVEFKRSAIYMLIGKGGRFIAWALIYYWIAPMFG